MKYSTKHEPREAHIYSHIEYVPLRGDFAVTGSRDSGHATTHHATLKEAIAERDVRYGKNKAADQIAEGAA